MLGEGESACQQSPERNAALQCPPNNPLTQRRYGLLTAFIETGDTRQWVAAARFRRTTRGPLGLRLNEELCERTLEFVFRSGRFSKDRALLNLNPHPTTFGKFQFVPSFSNDQVLVCWYVGKLLRQSRWPSDG